MRDNERFWSKVRVAGESECWEWLAYKDSDGYGRFRIGGEVCRAHRVAYELHLGPIKDDIHIIHACDNPACCNPAHLREGTHKDNMADKVVRGRGSKGEAHGSAKLTESQAFQIRMSRGLGIDLARKYGVSDTLISAIRNGKRWHHLGETT